MTVTGPYHIKKYADKARAALAEMQKTQRPDDQEGSEIDILVEVQKDLKNALMEGYSPQQIADALASVFPVSIKEILDAAGAKPAQALLDSKQTHILKDEASTSSALEKVETMRARLGRPRKNSSTIGDATVTRK